MSNAPPIRSNSPTPEQLGLEKLKISDGHDSRSRSPAPSSSSQYPPHQSPPHHQISSAAPAHTNYEGYDEAAYSGYQEQYQETRHDVAHFDQQYGHPQNSYAHYDQYGHHQYPEQGAYANEGYIPHQNYEQPDGYHSANNHNYEYPPNSVNPSADYNEQYYSNEYYQQQPGYPPQPYPHGSEDAYAQGYAQDYYYYGDQYAPEQYSNAEYSSEPYPIARSNTIHSELSAAEQPAKKKEEEFPAPTRELLEKYREEARTNNDPKIQLRYAKFLLHSAPYFADQTQDAKRARRVRDGMAQEAMKIVKRLGSQSGLGKPAYPEAAFFLANCYGTGAYGLAVDHDKAFSLYLQASKQNHASSTYRAAVCYEVGAGTKRDPHRAVQFFRKAAALGETAAMYKLGMILLNGLLSQQKNPREAVTWLKRAAAQADEDNPHALHELGLCYEKSGVPSVIPDEAYARELFTQAAQLGYAPSQFKLGCCYEYGLITCPVDPRRSIAWYSRAAEQGDPEAELALSGWYLTGSEGVLKQSDTEAYLWARRAADKGLSKAEYAVGYYSEVGIGVKQDLEEARRWYLRAAGQGNKRAISRLAELKNMGARPARREHTRTGKPDNDNCSVM
ncbi:uncharacterized protein VTP21DRAFT_996 [Calcarisporiella thermophila]|uniref:uncharacterized protein n=1 Tax=Calcarisporiella thermophila TaxID=911321 RepID=UPI0037436B85